MVSRERAPQRRRCLQAVHGSEPPQLEQLSLAVANLGAPAGGLETLAAMHAYPPLARVPGLAPVALPAEHAASAADPATDPACGCAR